MIQETLDKLQTVRDTLKDANEINEYKEKELNEKVKLVFYSYKPVSSMASKPIIIRWFRTGFQPYWKSIFPKGDFS